MAGGIQPGTTAWDKDSLRHDQLVRHASRTAFDILTPQYPGLQKYHKLLKEHLPQGVGACAPDGGVWFYEGKLVAAFEAKKQGPRGNAIERWYKNFFLLSQINEQCPLVTYAMGEGVQEGKPVHTILHAAHGGEFNSFRINGPSCFLQEEGFTMDELVENIVNFVEFQIGAATP